MRCFILIFFILCNNASFGQNESDSFFLVKKKGIWGRIGRSITKNTPDQPPVNIAAAFAPYSGFKIRYVDIVPLPYDVDMHDTAAVRKKSFTIK